MTNSMKNNIGKMEKCPRCGSVYIQYEEANDTFHCLVKSCGARWVDSGIDLKHVNNIYLRASIK